MGLLRWIDNNFHWSRIGVGLLLLGVSTALWFSGTFWPWGWVVGGLSLLLSGKSRSEKQGYNF